MRRTILVLATMALTLLVASGVALAVNKIGTNGPDTLRGTNGADNLLGKGGDDVLFGLAGRDNLLGGEGKNWVFGGNPNDRGRTYGGEKSLEGGSGNDAIQGGKGSDDIVGGGGNDLLFDDYAIQLNRKKDTLSSGDGNDVFLVWSRPASKDVVSCGSGFDRVSADRKDVIAPDCERVFVGESAGRAFFLSIPQSFWEGLPSGF